MAEYFDKVTYKPKYQMGDKVRGIWNNIPFSGTVQIDNMIDTYDGPFIIVYTDLPVKHENTVHTYLKIKHEDICEAFFENKKKVKKAKTK